MWAPSCDGTADYLLQDCGSVGHRHWATTGTTSLEKEAWAASRTWDHVLLVRHQSSSDSSLSRLDPQVVREVRVLRLDPSKARGNSKSAWVVSSVCSCPRSADSWPSSPFSRLSRVSAATEAVYTRASSPPAGSTGRSILSFLCTSVSRREEATIWRYHRPQEVLWISSFASSHFGATVWYEDYCGHLAAHTFNTWGDSTGERDCLHPPPTIAFQSR